VLNTTSTAQTVRIKVFRLDQQPVGQIFNQFLPINSFSANEFNAISLGSGANTVEQFYIEIFNMVPGLYPAAIQATNGGTLIDGTEIKTAEFIPILGNGIDP